MVKDGIEIHYDEKRGYVQLACEPDAFAAYREIAREHLKDFSEIPIDHVIEMNIIDTTTFVSRRDVPKRRIRDLIFGAILVLILALAVIGARAVVVQVIASWALFAVTNGGHA